MPTRKVGAGALAGAFSIILVWALKTYGKVELPGEVGAACTVVLTFITSWFVPEGE